MSIEERLLAVFRGVFGADLPPLADQTSPETLGGWDSAKHLSLIMALEAEFCVEFDTDEIAELTTVGAIRQRLE